MFEIEERLSVKVEGNRQVAVGREPQSDKQQQFPGAAFGGKKKNNNNST